jgi:hypothetical protein
MPKWHGALICYWLHCVVRKQHPEQAGITIIKKHTQFFQKSVSCLEGKKFSGFKES